MIQNMRFLLPFLCFAAVASADIRSPSPIPTGGGGWFDLISGFFLSIGAFFTGRAFWRKFRKEK